MMLKSEPVSTEKMLRLVKRQFKAAKLSLKVYDRRANGGADVTLSLPAKRDTNEIRLWVGRDVDFVIDVIDSCPVRRQVLVSLKEPRRVITNKLRLEVYQNRKYSKSLLESFARDRLSLPESAEYEFKYLGPICKVKGTNLFLHNVEYTATVPATELFFLIGFDEKHTFISMLPTAATSIAHADEVLKPVVVKRAEKSGLEVLRQGEWYLIKASVKEQSKIDKAVRSRISGKEDEFEMAYDESYLPDGVETDHIPLIVFCDKAIAFITGGIGSSRHYLGLEGWYKMVRNLEQEPPEGGSNWD
jgi:hypothetical protein